MTKAHSNVPFFIHQVDLRMSGGSVNICHPCLYGVWLNFGTVEPRRTLSAIFSCRSNMSVSETDHSDWLLSIANECTWKEAALTIESKRLTSTCRKQSLLLCHLRLSQNEQNNHMSLMADVCAHISKPGPYYPVNKKPFSQMNCESYQKKQGRLQVWKSLKKEENVWYYLKNI